MNTFLWKLWFYENFCFYENFGFMKTLVLWKLLFLWKLWFYENFVFMKTSTIHKNTNENFAFM
jgi:hypothetical protein